MSKTPGLVARLVHYLDRITGTHREANVSAWYSDGLGDPTVPVFDALKDAEMDPVEFKNFLKNDLEKGLAAGSPSPDAPRAQSDTRPDSPGT